MAIDRILRELRKPAAYPHDVDAVEVRQTHISAVFLAGDVVYKVKKPVDLGFLDFTTLERRLHYCREEVRLNRRLAPEVYLGVVTVTAGPDGGLHLEGAGEAVEHAVKMRRLPDDATLEARLESRTLQGAALERLGRRIARFHATAASGPRIASFGRWEVVARNARENLEESVDQVGVTVSREVHRRLDEILETRLRALRPLIDARAGRGAPRDTHGDLHLEHVYVFPEREPPRDLVVIDCIEFNERFRYADPVSDMAFLSMDLRFRGRWELEERFSRAYFDASDDPDGCRLLPFYRSYRAAVRGKVEGMAAAEEEVGPHERGRAVRTARGHWLLALSELVEPDRRPALVLVGGLPGTGKSTLAAALADEAGFQVISSDRVRKELAGLKPEAKASAGFENGLYAPEWTERTYTECLRRAREELFRGRRVIVDASFRDQERREAFLEAGREMGVRTVLLLCEAPASVVRERLETRNPGASDADWTIYRNAAEQWDELPAETDRRAVRISTAAPVSRTTVRTLDELEARGLSG